VIEEEVKLLMSPAFNDGHKTSVRLTPVTKPENKVDDFKFGLSLLIQIVKKHAPMKKPC